MGLGDTLGKMVGKGISAVSDKMDMINKKAEKASQMDDRTLVRRYNSATDKIDKTVYANEMKKRGLTPNDY